MILRFLVWNVVSIKRGTHHRPDSSYGEPKQVSGKTPRYTEEDYGALKTQDCGRILAKMSVNFLGGDII